MKEWASFSDSVVTAQFAQGVLYGTTIAELNQIFRESHTVIAPSVQANVKNLLRWFQAEFTGGHVSGGHIVSRTQVGRDLLRAVQKHDGVL